MNKRVPLLLSLLGVILLAASIAYWILQLYQPPQRPIAAVPVAQMPDPAIDAAASLFGGQIAVASATNYQLTGVVAGPSNSVAIIVAEGSPPKALVVGKELSPGITLAEVHARYVMLSDNGVMKRIDLAPDTKGAAPMGGAPSDNPPPPMSNVNNGATPIMPPPANAPTGNVVAEPPMAPGAVQQQMPVNPADAGAQQQNPNVAPVNNPNNPNIQNNPNAVNPANQAPAPVQMPPPTRAVNPNGVAPAVR